MYSYDFHEFTDKVVILGVVFPRDFWDVAEPGYVLPAGYIGRLFTEGHAHHLVRAINNTYDQSNVNDTEIAGYVARMAEYDVAYAAYQAGAYVENVGGIIGVYGPPSLSADKTEIANDGVESITVTCDLGDAVATDEIRWSVTAPDGSVINEVDNAVAGVDSWQLTTSHVGVHTVAVETDYFGWAEILFEGV